MKTRTRKLTCLLVFSLLTLLQSSPLRAALKPETVHIVEARKNQAYVREGLFVGGDRAIQGVTVKDIRRAANSKYERIVIDLEGIQSGDVAALSRPPYYQIAVSQGEKRLLLTLWGKPKLSFNSVEVLRAFKKSSVVSALELLPRVEEDAWTFAVTFTGNRAVEVFELSNPTRIIVDIKNDKLAGKH